MFDIFLVTVPLFIIIFGSAFLTRLNVASVGWQEELNAFALKIGFPALIFSALAKMEFSFVEHADLLISNSVFLVMSFVAVFVFGKLFRVKPKMFRTLFLCLGFGNIAYLGIPALTQSFGVEIIPEASLIVAVYLFWVFTVGVGFLEYLRKKEARGALKKVGLSIVKNPLLLAVLFGLIFSYFNVSIPDVFQKSLDMLSASVTPVVLVVIGLFLGNSKWGRLKEWIPSILFAVCTLFLLPAVFYFVVKGLNLEVADFSASIVDAAMPLAITPFALADEYKLDKSFIARSIVLSTVLAVVTIPFWIYVL